jgi:small subunit ribosomal protein S4
MKFGPKYKIARRLGASVFEKTQTAKFALRSERKQRTTGRPKSRTNFGIQLIEKQRVRFTYGLSEKQFSKYVHQVIEKKGVANPAEMLYTLLEQRLDNVVLRSGFAASRPAARQLVSHGHIVVNGVKMTIPSYQVRSGDVISIREGSKNKTVFADLDEKMKDLTFPTWLSVQTAKKEITIAGTPTFVGTNLPFDLQTVIQFYKR